MNPAEKSFTELANNDLSKECLKYSYGIVYHILEVSINTQDENYMSILSPLFYYWIEHKSVLEYMYATHKHLKEKLILYHSKLKVKLAKRLEEKKDEMEKLNKIVDEFMLSNDKLLLGFVPLMPYMHKRSIWDKKLYGEADQYDVKLVALMRLLTAVGCSSDQVKVKDFNLKKMITRNLRKRISLLMR